MRSIISTGSRSATRQAFTRRVESDRKFVGAAMTRVDLPDGTWRKLAVLGTGPTVVCVGTIAEMSFVYAPQIRGLAERHRVVLYEPACSTQVRVSIDDRADELRGIIAAVGGGPVHLLAWSDSGSVAYRLAARRPELIASMVLLGLADRYRFPGPLQALARALYQHPIQRLVPTVTCRMLLAWFNGGRRAPRGWVFAESGQIPDLRALLKFSILPCMVEHRPRPGEVTVPSLLIGGDRDALVSVASMRAMADMLGPAGRFMVVPGGEHMLGYAAAGVVSAAIASFVDAVGIPTVEAR